MKATQADIVTALALPTAYAEPPAAVTHLQTHVSHVFLAGPCVYKLKKAIVFPFLDFRTLGARQHACSEEVRLNRRWARHVYLGVVPITRARDGAIMVGGIGKPLDWVVHMRRLPETRTLRHLLAHDALTHPIIESVARHIARLHADATVVAGGHPDMLRTSWDENLAGVRGWVGRYLAPEDFDLLADFGRSFVARHDALLHARIRGGFIREGHGDLRTDHVYVLDHPHDDRSADHHDPAIAVIDCVEFDLALRTIDVAADIAFLAMDLTALGRPDLATAFVAAYADEADDPVVTSLIPYYACHRATVRGKVDALTAAGPDVDVTEREAAAARAAHHFVVATRYAWQSGDPVVIACAGLSGTGKSTIAAALAKQTGFARVSTDHLRKTTRPSPSYDAASRSAVYGRMHREVARALGAGDSIIVDATFTSRAERDRLADCVRGLGRRHVFLECVADDGVIGQRLAARDETSESDARWDVYLQQRRERQPYAPDEPMLPVDTTEPPADLRPDLTRRLWSWRQGRAVA